MCRSRAGKFRRGSCRATVRPRKPHTARPAADGFRGRIAVTAWTFANNGSSPQFWQSLIAVHLMPVSSVHSSWFHHSSWWLFIHWMIETIRVVRLVSSFVIFLFFIILFFLFTTLYTPFVSSVAFCSSVFPLLSLSVSSDLYYPVLENCWFVVFFRACFSCFFWIRLPNVNHHPHHHHFSCPPHHLPPQQTSRWRFLLFLCLFCFCIVCFRIIMGYLAVVAIVMISCWSPAAGFNRPFLSPTPFVRPSVCPCFWPTHIIVLALFRTNRSVALFFFLSPPGRCISLYIGHMRLSFRNAIH